MNEWPKPIEPPEMIQDLANAIGGKISDSSLLPDGSGFCTMSFPLPDDHWIYGKDDPTHPVHGFRLHPPPMPFRMGSEENATVAVFPNDGYPHRHCNMTRDEFADKIRSAGKYAVRASTMDGKEMDFDPDAMLQNLIVGMIGYWTANGLSGDDWDNPSETTTEAP